MTLGDPSNPDPPEPRSDGSDHRVDRRTFIAGGAVLGGAVILDGALAHAKAAFPYPTGRAGLPIGTGQPALIDVTKQPTFSTLLRRREDFVYLRIDGWNLKRQGQSLVRVLRHRDAFLVVGFVPQHVAEQAYPDPGGSPKQPGESNARLAYPSRLAFKLPVGRVGIPLTVVGLLAWDELAPSLVPAAAFGPPRHFNFDQAPRLQPPTDTESALELPWRLVISPLSDSHWSHPTDVIERGDWTELWHTRLAADATETAADGGAFRAVWNFDFDGRFATLDSTKLPKTDDTPFLTSLNSKDRYQIVRASGDFRVSGRADVQANKLWLSARGGFLDSIGEWPDLLPRTTFDLAEWKHIATLGRDQYVKVVTKGFLFPFGHRAVLIKVTERLFEKNGSEIVANFRQIQYIVVRQPEKSYATGDLYGITTNGGIPTDSRDFPFRSLTLKTARTPDLDPTKSFFAYKAGHDPFPADSDPFVPTVGGQEFLWHFVGTDWIGRQVPFTAPSVFVDQSVAFNSSMMTLIRNRYNYGEGATATTNIGNFTGRHVAFGAAFNSGDTDLELHQVTFGALAGSGGSDDAYADADQPRCYPTVVTAQVRLSAAEQASGVTQPLTNISYSGPYVDRGFNVPGINQGNVFAEIASGATGPSIPFSQGGGSSGGVITPDIVVSGISRSLGPVAGNLADLATGTFKPSDVFSNALNARILGGVTLAELIQTVSGISGDTITPGDQGSPLMIKYANALTPGSPPTEIITNLNWQPTINLDNPIVTTIPGSAAQVGFLLEGQVITNLVTPTASTFSVTGQLQNFAVTLMSTGAASFIEIDFNELTFKAKKGQKSSVSVDVANVSFLGPLKFVQDLEELMNFLGEDGSGPSIQILPTGIESDLAVPLPDFAVGIFAISGISINCGFNLPFTGAPARFRFSVSTQDNPFQLSVAIFGGQGFFGIAIGTDGVELIQASFDFGACASIDLGVASGSVHIVAGIYFAYGQVDPPSTATGCVLTGFIKLGGSLSILGIITLSLEFDLSLTYSSLPSPQVTGTATMSVGVKILFFSFSVSVTASKTFAVGSSNNGAVGSQLRSPHSVLSGGAAPPPPGFTDQYTPDTPAGTTSAAWTTYCQAFGRHIT